VVPDTVIATAVPYESTVGDFPRVYYNDPNFGQRIDSYLNINDDEPYLSQVTLTSVTPHTTYFLFHNYNDMKYSPPLCLESNNNPPPIPISLAFPLGMGSVLNEPTQTFTDQSYEFWYEVVNNTDYYYLRSVSTISDAYFVTSFQVVTPNHDVWDLPNCFSEPRLSASTIPPPIAPFPSAGYSYTESSPAPFISQFTSYIDNVNRNSRFDIEISTLIGATYIQINTNSLLYIMMNVGNISPIPCIYVNSTSHTTSIAAEYLGTVLLENEANKSSFDIYGSFYEYLAFDSATNEYKASFSYDYQTIVTNWIPTPPPPSTFTPPSECYFLPFSNNVDHSEPIADGISFPTSFTMFINYGGRIINIYYNGDNLMWRYDFQNSSIVQIGNTQHQFNNPLTANPAINPLPCVQNNVNFAFPLPIPTSLPIYYGQANYNGNTIDIYGINVLISYWFNGSPLLFLGYNLPPLYVEYYQPGPPPMNVFNVPSLCIVTQSSELFPINSSFKRMFPFKN